MHIRRFVPQFQVFLKIVLILLGFMAFVLTEIITTKMVLSITSNFSDLNKSSNKVNKSYRTAKYQKL